MKAFTSGVQKQIGLTLVELLISMFLSSIVLLGLFKVFDANFQYYRVIQSDGSMQDSSRAASYFVSDDIRNAGGYGCFQPSTFLSKIKLPGNYIANPQPLFFMADSLSTAIPLDQQQAEESSFYLQDNIDGNVFVGERVPELGTDILTIKTLRKLAYIRLQPGSMARTGDTKIVVTGDNISKGHMIFMNCRGASRSAELVNVTSVKELGEGNVELTLEEPLDANYPPDDSLPADSTSVSFYQPQRIIYFVAEGSAWNVSGAQSLSLFRQFNGSVSELVSGIEDFQVRFVGVDVLEDGDGDEVSGGEDANNGQANLLTRQILDGSNIANSAANSTEVVSIMVRMVVRGELSGLGRSDSERSDSAGFTGIPFGKTDGDPYDDDGRLRRIVGFSNSIRSQLGHVIEFPEANSAGGDE
ncbi:Uncharacterised protein [BD1-7 clade bacterium]|uniref:Uncharacterized protein n=1 Tax=BD1-7 clade bacterium TaxID=2029982 RepID=A0A5S9PV41_9GAMM|nr:Uncharacterised protein [BD1-7 clade bacterium]CAA0108747.1 Uncharacterised protein [BD1-7 clade bacterium]